MRIVNLRPAVLELPDGTRLNPGMNDVNVDMGALTQSAIWKLWLENSYIQVLDETQQAPDTSPKDLTDRRPEAAAALIEAESDTNILRRWRKAETRRDIQKLLDTRLLSLQGESK